MTKSSIDCSYSSSMLTRYPLLFKQSSLAFSHVFVVDETMYTHFGAAKEISIIETNKKFYIGLKKLYVRLSSLFKHILHLRALKIR